MPYRWSRPTPDGSQTLTLWPHRSLTARGFVGFIAATATLLGLPLIALLGTPALWVIFAFMAASLAAIWAALARNHRDRSLSEVLSLRPGTITLTRHNPGGATQTWSDNPYWTRVTLYASSGPVPDYLTLKGQGREVELGRFLTPDERRSLAADLRAILAAIDRPQPPPDVR